VSGIQKNRKYKTAIAAAAGTRLFGKISDTE